MNYGIIITAFLVGAVIVWVIFLLWTSPMICPRKGCWGRRRSLTLEETEAWIDAQIAARQNDPGASTTRLTAVTATGKVPMKCRSCGELTYL